MIFAGSVEQGHLLPNACRGNDPTKWRTDLPTYAKVCYSGVYPGVDLVYYGNQRQPIALSGTGATP
jgi:hypothetical protein